MKEKTIHIKRSNLPEIPEDALYNKHLVWMGEVGNKEEHLTPTGARIITNGKLRVLNTLREYVSLKAIYVTDVTGRYYVRDSNKRYYLEDFKPKKKWGVFDRRNLYTFRLIDL